MEIWNSGGGGGIRSPGCFSGEGGQSLLAQVGNLSPLLQSQGAITAIIVVFSLLAALLLAVGLVLLVRKLREKRQTEGTYRPSSEEQVGARVPPPPNLNLPPEERLI